MERDFKGGGYDGNLSTSGICKKIKEYGAKQFPKCKFSVSKDGYNSIVIAIMSGDFDEFKKWHESESRQFNHYQYGSKRYENQVLECNRIYQKITDIKTDYINKITTEPVKTYDLVKVEYLNIKGMVKNHKLAESISECNRYRFVQTLEYK